MRFTQYYDEAEVPIGFIYNYFIYTQCAEDHIQNKMSPRLYIFQKNLKFQTTFTNKHCTITTIIQSIHNFLKRASVLLQVFSPFFQAVYT